MADFDTLNGARAALFQAVHRAVNDGSFALVERSALNDLLAETLAGDHLLLVEERVRALPSATILPVETALKRATSAIRGVLDGANSRDERRIAIDLVDDACVLLRALIDG